MPRPPIDLPYPFPHGQESDIEPMRHYDASNGQRYQIDPKYGEVSKLSFFHFAREIEQGIQSKRLKMTKEEKIEDNKVRDANRNKLKLQDQMKRITPATENQYSRTDDEGNVMPVAEKPRRTMHFDAGCNCYTGDNNGN